MYKNAEHHKPAVASPCIRQCCLDEHEVCMGCGRHLNEILTWSDATSEERLAMLDISKQRLEEKRS
jgi:uncharacterized protein